MDELTPTDKKLISEIVDASFEGEVWLSTDGKHTVHIKSSTEEGRKAGGEWAIEVYRKLEERLPTRIGLATKQAAQRAPQSTTEAQKTCAIHGVVMESAISAKTNKRYWSHKDEMGRICFGNGYKEAL